MDAPPQIVASVFLDLVTTPSLRRNKPVYHPATAAAGILSSQPTSYRRLSTRLVRDSGQVIIWVHVADQSLGHVRKVADAYTLNVLLGTALILIPNGRFGK
jgi:hypothetical protein